MRILISAPELSKPTYEDIEEYAQKRLEKLKKLLPHSEQTNHDVRIGIEKENYLFDLVLEIFYPNHIVAKVKHKDIKTALDKAIDKLIRELNSGHDKAIDKSISARRETKDNRNNVMPENI